MSSEVSRVEVEDMNFTVAVCTRDRLALLREAVPPILEQLAAFPNGRLLIVDNGSKDGTPDYLARLAGENPNVAHVVERKPGLYFARARAVAEATGAIVLFTDDDVLIGPNWIAAILDAFAKDPAVGVVGTTIKGLWEAPRPSWFSDRMLREIPVISIPENDAEYRYPCYPPGASLAIRAHPCMKLYLAPERLASPLGFTEAMARGGKMVSGDDTDLCEIYARNGFKIIGISNTHIHHRVVASKFSDDWLVGKFESDGRLLARFARVAGRRVLDGRGLLRLAAYPILLLAQPLRPLLPKRQSVLLRAYWRRSHGFWNEVLFGWKGVSYPYVHADPSVGGADQPA